MNVVPSRSLLRASPRATRAQLSPLLRRVTQAAFTRRIAAESPSVDRLWNPHLLDRLQTPLTRFHD